MTALKITGLHHTYRGKRKRPDTEVLKGINLTVRQGSIFGFLGPNGSGKTTLFKILSTLLEPTSGSLEMFGFDIGKSPFEIRRKIGVVFQHPSLDKKLTVLENMRHQGHLYGISGAELDKRIDRQLDRFRINDRRNEMVENLSGGQRRRVEIAKGLMHKPELLILDEPSTGLDLGARRDLWDQLMELRDKDGVTVLVTTHLIAEAELCDSLAILHDGDIVCQGAPEELKSEIGGDVLTISSPSPSKLVEKLKSKVDGSLMVVNGKVRIEKKNAHKFLPELVDEFPELVNIATYGKPTLEDVFIHRTGQSFWVGNGGER